MECSRTFKESSLLKESSLVEEGVGGKNTACLEASRTLKESSPCEESSQVVESSLKESSMESSQPPLLLPILVPRPIPCDSDGPQACNPVQGGKDVPVLFPGSKQSKESQEWSLL